MSSYTITCCTTCDLSLEHIRELGVPYAPYHFILDGKDYHDDFFTAFSKEKFYDMLESGAMPSTAQVTIQELIEVIEPILASGQDVLHIEFSSGLSGGYQMTTVEVQKILVEKYPERKFLIVDSLAGSTGYGMMVEQAVSLKNQGKSIEEVYTWLQDNKLKMVHYFFATNLEHFKRGGRISSAAAAIGNMLNVCPVMELNNEGKIVIRKKCFGKKKAIRELVNHMIETAQDGINYSGKFYLCNSIAEDDAHRVAELIKEQFPHIDLDTRCNTIGPVIGSHTSKGAVGLFYWAKEDRKK